MRPFRFLLLLILCLPYRGSGQGIVWEKGTSTATLGMFAYDPVKANDRQARRYLYTLRPEGAAEIWVDFGLQAGPEGVVTNPVRIYAGADTTAPLVAELGGGSGSRLVRVPGPVLCFYFDRSHAAGLQTAWTTYWRAVGADARLEPGKPDARCPEVIPVCGSLYTETGKLPFFDLSSELGPLGFDPQTPEVRLYSFLATQNGYLEFELRPDDPRQDLDWALWQVGTRETWDCPRTHMRLHAPVSRNLSAGNGIHGATGMSRMGRRKTEVLNGSPYCVPIPVRKGDRFLLAVSARPQHARSWTLHLPSPLILDCANPPAEMVYFSSPPLPRAPAVQAHTVFTSANCITRLNLEEKGNQHLNQCSGPADFHVFAPAKGAAAHPLPGTRGLVPLLLEAVRAGLIPVYPPDGSAEPLSYGDLLYMAHRLSGDTLLPAISPDSLEFADSWWEARESLLEPLCRVVDLVQVEKFYRTEGVSKVETQFLRLVWTDFEAGMPDLNVGLIRIQDALPLLNELQATSRFNDQATLTVYKTLMMNQYSGIRIPRNTRGARFSPDAGLRAVEYENYNWQR